MNFIKKHAVLLFVVETLLVAALIGVVVFLFIDKNKKTTNDNSQPVETKKDDNEKNQEVKEDTKTTTKEETKKETKKEDPNSKYLGKYIGVGNDTVYAKESYVELKENNVAFLNINMCEGFVLYKGTFKVQKMEYDDGYEIYISNIKPYKGYNTDITDTFVFQVDGNKLHASWGFLGADNYDCGVSTLKKQ